MPASPTVNALPMAPGANAAPMALAKVPPPMAFAAPMIANSVSRAPATEPVPMALPALTAKENEDDLIDMSPGAFSPPLVESPKSLMSETEPLRLIAADILLDFGTDEEQSMTNTAHAGFGSHVEAPSRAWPSPPPVATLWGSPSTSDRPTNLETAGAKICADCEGKGHDKDECLNKSIVNFSYNNDYFKVN